MIYRPSMLFSKLYIDLMKTFGDGAGFNTILEKTRKPLNAELLCAFIDLIASPHDVYHRSFVRGTIEPFVDSVLKYLTNLSEDELRNLKKESLEAAVTQIEKLMCRVYTVKRKTEELIKLRVGIGLSLLRSTLLDKRIHAIRLISETCKSAKQSQYRQAQGSPSPTAESRALTKMLQVPQIIEQIFGKCSHIQLIQRSTEILKFCLLNNSLTKEELDLIWECCVKDEQSKVEIFKVFADSLHYLSKELISFMIGKFATTPSFSLKDADAALICEFGHKFSYIPKESLAQALDLMWNISLKKADYCGVLPEMREKVLDRLCELITTPYHVGEEIMNEYLARSYKMVEQNDCNLAFALRMLRKSLKQLPNLPRFQTRTEAQNFYLQEGKLISQLYSVQYYYHGIEYQKWPSICRSCDSQGGTIRNP